MGVFKEERQSLKMECSFFMWWKNLSQVRMGKQKQNISS